MQLITRYVHISLSLRSDALSWIRIDDLTKQLNGSETGILHGASIFHRFTNEKTFFSAQSTTKKSTHPKEPRAENETIETPGIELKHLVTYKSRKIESRIRTYNTPCINDDARCTTTASSRVPQKHQTLTETDKLYIKRTREKKRMQIGRRRRSIKNGCKRMIDALCNHYRFPQVCVSS
jgi:hypothetical protein